MKRPGPLTTRGRLFVVSAVAALALARVIGVVELAVLAAVAALALVAAVAWVRNRTVDLAVDRVVRPDRVVAGTAAVATLTVTNRAKRVSRVLTAYEYVDHAGSPESTSAAAASFGVPHLVPGETATATYPLPTQRRGVYRVGPLRLAVSDPLGLAEATVARAGSDHLVVYPKVEEVRPLLGTSRRGFRIGTAKPVRAPVGPDFFGLREYEMGDDLRRVHWPSTARHGQLMLREDEISHETDITTVLLDTRSSTQTPESFERAVEVAASIVSALSRARARYRFMTTGGFELRSVGGDRYFAVMEFLAGVARDGGSVNLGPFVEGLRRDGDGPLAVVTTDVPDAESRSLGLLARRFSPMILVALRPSAYGGSDRGPAPALPGAIVVPVSESLPFPLGWDTAVMGCGRREAPAQRGAAARA